MLNFKKTIALFHKIIHFKKNFFFLFVLILVSVNSYAQATNFVGHSTICRERVSTISVSVPGGSVDDLLIASITGDNSNGNFITFSASSDWIPLRTGQSADGNTTLAVFYRIADNTEPNSYSFSLNGRSVGACASIVRYDDVDVSANPILVSSIARSPGTSVFNTTQPVSPSVNAKSNSTVVRIVGVDNNFSLGSPSGTAQRVNNNNFFGTIGIADSFSSNAGNSGTARWSYGSRGGGWVAVTIGFAAEPTADPCDPIASGNLDSDGDGISDVCDIDDDNDGILDTVESETTFFTGGTASQSSSINNPNCPNFNCSASLARDGNTDGNFNNGSVTHTRTSANPWWMLDMETSLNIESVILYNRTNCCGERLNNFRLEVLDNNNNILYTHINGTASIINTVSNINTVGSKIRIRLVGSGRVLSLAEVVVKTSSDLDGDGVPNSLDLDSDNDGCPDAIEAAIPSVLKSSGTNANDGIANNTENAVIDITKDGVGTNGFANSLESNDTDTATGNVLSVENYKAYALENSKNGCGTAIITQVYWNGSEKIVEVTNNDTSNFLVPTAVNINLFNNGTTNTRTATVKNTLEIPAGESVLFVLSGSVNAQVKAGTTTIIGTGFNTLDNANDIITISRSGIVNSAFPWETRTETVQDLTDNTSFVRIDDISEPNKTYTSTEWVMFVDDDISTLFNDFLRHPHDPVLSEITSGVNVEANALLGLHRFGPTTIENDVWSDGFPDRSRHVIINQKYNHQNEKLNARKLEVKGSNILSLNNQPLIVTNEINIADNAEIRLIGFSQLIQTHSGTTNISGNGKLYIDQNTELENIYRYNYMSSPVITVNQDTYSIETVLKDGTNPTSHIGIVGQGKSNIARDINFVSGYDGSIGVPINIADYWIYTFASSHGTRANWVQKKKNGIIAPTDGFIIKSTGVNQNYTFVGSPNDGELNTNVGGNENYLLGNPFPSALNGLKFIQDNINSIAGSLYFWNHVGEKDTSGSSTGHYYRGYIGGYATLNLSMSVSSLQKPLVGAFEITLQAEDATTDVIQENGALFEYVTLSGNKYIAFNSIPKSTDEIIINYRSNKEKTIVLKVDDIVVSTYNLPKSTNYTSFSITHCIPSNSTIRLESTDNNSISIDNIVIKDDDGIISCAPSPGNDASLYKEPGTYVPVGQGFFVRGDSNGGPIVFNNSQRQFVTEGSNAVFFKSLKKKSKKAKTSDNNGDFNRLPMIKLGMDFISDQGESLHRQIGVSFSEKNSFNFEKGYDSQINDLYSTDIYWKFPGSDNKYIIAGIENISNELEIPFEIVMNYNGAVVLNVDETLNIEKEIFIKDKLTNQTMLLTNNQVSLQLEKGTYTDRFTIVFTENSVLSTDNNIIDAISKDISIFIDKNSKELVLKNNGISQISKVLLFNLLGQKITSWQNIEPSNENRLKVKNIADNIYIVNIQTDKGILSKKIMIE